MVAGDKPAIGSTTGTADIWKQLRKPFPKEAIGLLPRPFDKNSSKGNCKECGKYHALPAVHLDYVGHAAVTDRLNTVAGPDNWNWEPLAFDELGLPMLDHVSNLWIKLTINGVTKLGVGDGKNAKEVIGDAIRNAAMRFGVALDLWSKEELESTLDDPSLKNEKPSEAPSPKVPLGAVRSAQKIEISNLLTDLAPVPKDEWAQWVKERYDIDLLKLTNLVAEQLLDKLRKDAARSMEPTA